MKEFLIRIVIKPAEKETQFEEWILGRPRVRAKLAKWLANTIQDFLQFEMYHNAVKSVEANIRLPPATPENIKTT